MSEVKQILWAHGFGSFPDIDPTSRAVRRALGARAKLVVPALSRFEDGVLTVFPPSEQGKVLNAGLDRDSGPDVVVGHSQGAWGLGEAISACPGRQLGRVVLGALPLTGPLQRLTREFRAPSPVERGLVEDFGGVYLVKDGTRPGQPRLTVIPRQYWAEVADPHFDALDTAELLLGHSTDPGLILAGDDERLNNPAQAKKLDELAGDMELTADRVVTLEGAGHYFTGAEYAEAIARIALEGFAANTTDAALMAVVG